MAKFLGRDWTKQDLLSFVGDSQQLARATRSVLSAGKATGVEAVDIRNGSGFDFTVLPGRGMDIPFASYKGVNLNFFSPTGITSPAYYEEPGDGWLRSFYAGLLTTCGITYAGHPGIDQGKAYGLHGRLANAAAEDVCVGHEWQGNEYVVSVSGRMREAAVMAENVSLTRTIHTRLGWDGFELHDVIENSGFDAQPLMLLYHFNVGFPLLGPNSKIVARVTQTRPRDEEAARDAGVEEALTFAEPKHGYNEKVFFHTLDGPRDAKVAIANRDIGNGTPMALLIEFDREELPCLTEWKMPRRGCYALGLEPGTVPPLPRHVLREREELPFIEPQSNYDVHIRISATDDPDTVSSLLEGWKD